jgi:hypothetical protein
MSPIGQQLQHLLLDKQALQAETQQHVLLLLLLGSALCLQIKPTSTLRMSRPHTVPDHLSAASKVA